VEPLVDSWGREIKSVRVSVTDKCNFRCRYCMPAEGLEWLEREELLSFEEIARLVRVLAAMGVEEVRLTGGEPLVRRELPVLVRQLSEIPGVNDLSLTTNGVLLDKLAGPLVEAGLRRLNVSLDSLSHVRFSEITRRDALDRVLAGLEEAERYPELGPIKVNCVAMRGFTEEEVPALAELARRKPYIVRFIEFMPLDADESWRGDDVLTGGEIRALIEERWPLEEIARLVRVLAAMGVEEVRLTGGEPLVRRELPVLVRQLSEIPGVNDLSLTTNGVLLDRLAGPLVEAGLRRLNVSLDSLSHVRFSEITRRDALDRVLAGLEEAERYPELGPIKVNCVAMRGFTEEEVPALAELARRKPYIVRFIEFMPLDADESWRDDDVLTGGEIRALIEERWPLEEIPAKPSSTARRYRFADGAGEIGFVNPVSEPFCSSCDRIRLTADGQLRTCLFSRREWDLKTPLREGAADEELERLLRFAVRHKELKHKINDPGFVRASRSMSQIGG
jgi:cyclic pyranopterin phosphate synthase